MDRFKSLMNRYLDGTLTNEETLEFMELVADGDYADQISDEVRAKIAEEAHPRENESFTNAYDKIRTVLNFTTEDEPVPDDASEETQTKIVPFRRSRFWYARAAAIVVIAMATGLLVLSRGTKWFDPFFTQQQEVKLARFQGRQLVDLPDGSKIVLNANSELNYNRVTFGKTTREVNLIGEATFDVAYDASKPFVVHTGKVNTKVLGTEFNVHAYPEQDNITVTVLRGLVEVGDERRVYCKIERNQEISINTITNEFKAKDVNAENAIAWKQRFFILDGVTMAEAAVLIGERFNVRITIANDSIKNCVIVAWFLNNEDLHHILTAISGVQQATFTMKNGDVVIEGGVKCERG